MRRVFGDGVPLIDATRSSEDLFIVWENKTGSTVLLEIPRPSILAAVTSSSCPSLSGLVDIDDRRLKSSSDPDPSIVLPPSSAPLTADVAAFEVMIPGSGLRVMIPSRPVPSLAHSHMPRRGDVSSIAAACSSSFASACPSLGFDLLDSLSGTW